MPDAYVRSETHNGITTIEFYHPHSNSLPGALLQDLARTFKRLGDEIATKVIVLRAAGDRAFCAGASFEELSAIEDEKSGHEFFKGFANVINAMRECPKLIIGRIHGKCVGGGVGLAAAVDYAIAVEGADVKLSELAIGIGPFVVGPAVERKIGRSAFSQLALDATMWRNADWARRKGLYAELHPSVTEMDEAVGRLANTLIRTSPEAMKELKSIFWEGTEHWDRLLPDRAAISGRLVLSEFAREAISKFRNK